MALHPTVIKNTFLSHLVFWVVFLPFLSYLLLPLVMDTQNIDPREMTFVSNYVPDMHRVNEKSAHIFSALFVDTGAMSVTEDFFSGARAPTKHNYDSSFGNMSAAWAATWIHGVWSMIYKSIWRFNALMSIALFPTLALAAAAIVDGFSTRAKKQYNFERSNQVFFYTSTHTAVLIIGMFVFLPIVPIALTAEVIAGFMFMLTVALWFATSNFQTGT